MKFESLPNDIFLHCFEYLNAPDIFYAFEQLNPRFYRLIRTISLRLNFEDINKSIFDRFCEKMLDYTEIQQQIYSLKLSNEQAYCQIQAFFTYFSLVEFTRLRSLTLIEVKQNDIEQLSSTLPLLSQLICLRLIPSLSVLDTLLHKLPKCKPNILSTSSISSTLSSQEIIPLTKLSVKFGMMNHIYQMLLHMPLLEYLNISRGLQFDSVSTTDIGHLHGRVNHLKYLNVSNCMVNTDNLMDVIAYMINLRSLTVSVYENSDIIDASRWKHLITSSLPHLTVFRFRFGTFDRNEIIRKYEDFQTNFWIKEHQWYTECLLGDQILSQIFTIPYLNDTRSMWLKYVRHFNTRIDHSKTFDNVTDLHLPGEELLTSNGFYFPNIRSLVIHSLPVFANEKIPLCSQTTRPTISLEILKEAPNLSSLNIYNCAIDILNTNKEICRYTSEMIKKLQFCVYSQPNPCQKPHDVSSIHKVFPNVEQMTCPKTQPDTCLFLLNNLPKLSTLTIHFYQSENDSSFSKVKEELSKLKNIFFYEEILRAKQHVKLMAFGFWVGRGDITT
ncbi:unnamed protein product [Rotaria sp. Silwood1]|nr:unnamed protein product [Rotaria sp. Silwood1]CAF1625560.1 unnamed protein product [Rotaria sp. Silwood1]